MSDTSTPDKPEAPKAPLSAEAIVDLRARVLRGEAVSDDELRHALNSLAMTRGTGSTAAAKEAKSPVYTPSGSLADRMAAFKAKVGKTDAAGAPQIDAPPESKPQ